jgi:hypothetical protein
MTKGEIETLERHAGHVGPRPEHGCPGCHLCTARAYVAERLPRLIACARFIEEHGETLDYVLRGTFSHRDDCFTDERAALAALEALRGAK